MGADLDIHDVGLHEAVGNVLQDEEPLGDGNAVSEAHVLDAEEPGDVATNGDVCGVVGPVDVAIKFRFSGAFGGRLNGF